MTAEYAMSAGCPECDARLWLGGYCPDCGEWFSAEEYA